MYDEFVGAKVVSVTEVALGPIFVFESLKGKQFVLKIEDEQSIVIYDI